MNYRFLTLLFVFFTALSACSERADTPRPEAATLEFEAADDFLQFINTQASLGAGSYTLVVGTQTAGVSGTYGISVNINGTISNLQGSWSSSGGLDPNPANNPNHTLTLNMAGGLTTTTSSAADTYLYLLKNGVLVAEGEEIDLPVSQIDSQTYTDAYYRAVDPNNERLTLTDWQQVNGFSQGYDVHVVFRDTKDLGYGRNMYARRDAITGDISFFVQNYAADIGGAEGQYSSANVVAAIQEMGQYHIGTNAIEFSPIDPNDPLSERILKFFTFRKDPQQGNAEVRMDTANLDGRGEKQMPIPCLVCHGARLLPLDENGDFQMLSLKSAKLNQLEVDTFEFADTGMFQKDLIEPDIKIINEYVNEVYLEIGAQDPTNFNRWDSAFALELSEGRYGGAGFPFATYDDTFIPTGWREDPSRPDGVEQLYSEVIQPHCISCHSIRGKSVAEVNNTANDINFSTYEKFMSYNDKVIDYVYKRGIMPLSLLNYKAFWAQPEGAPAILASFLNGFDLYNVNNLPMEPGRPFAKPGENRTAWSPVQLNASASLYARTYLWSIVSQPGGSTATFSNNTIANPIFTADMNGNYVLRLTVSNDLGSHNEETTITIDNSLSSPLQKSQTELTFVDDIMDNIMGATAENNCANCHRSRAAHEAAAAMIPTTYDGRYDGIPVFYSYYVDGTATVNTNLYRHVRARVNLADPENSLLLRKPTGNHHGGDVRIDRDTLAGEAQYQILLNWIREGAVCGDANSVNAAAAANICQ